ncbi:phosphoribosyltransferase [Chitinophaga agrisoli]|uniref:Phosphoribosyltransferase n=1 Tax=Chitinophaga agrisoli TaxID=2607653 RepID=A0A5B2VZI0_9BACT|nr:phosphoribosyltransferase family protein [Chitinophaga agrisoli]KAA2243439.1 phosphoribosyltransferase [Chitinophaga agrisoli]
MATKNVILTEDIIQKKLERIAYEIYEHNSAEPEIILAGIWDRGLIMAQKIAAILQKIAPFKIHLIELRLDKQHPLEVKLSTDMDLTDKVIVLIDDVANSGRTMLYALKPFLQYLPRKIQTAVLVDRRHKSFPLSVDFVGYSLSTTLQDMVMVDVEGEEIRSAYLV